ncbi:hypothetical protein [Vibrio mediterranei]|uniref:hypothetical protein n=1 Tax=Vibrio mediterranei TaxID=689 RepID=UPI00148D8156|nr:hypothetical protein [Vibrio mediterranei]NOI26373.1 hypothetical protein [Vibrio mediterranei]
MPFPFGRLKFIELAVGIFSFLSIIIISIKLWLPSDINVGVVNEKSVIGIIQSWTDSQSFKDSLYTFNIEGVRRELEDALTIVSQYINGYHVCISLELYNFTDDMHDVENLCTDGSSMSSIKASNGITIGSFERYIGDKKLATLTYFIEGRTRSNIMTLLKYSSLLSVLLLVVISNLAMFYNRKNVVFKDSIKDVDDSLEVLKCIFNKNKQSFAFNGNLICVEYEHPYSLLFYKNNRTLKIRASLSEIEKTNVLRMVKINRSVLFNYEYIDSCRVSNSSNKSLSIKTGSFCKEYQVGNQYWDNLILNVKGDNVCQEL